MCRSEHFLTYLFKLWIFAFPMQFKPNNKQVKWKSHLPQSSNKTWEKNMQILLKEIICRLHAEEPLGKNMSL